MKQFDPRSKQVFVFGSNRAGIHGAGAALTARLLCGAVRGIGEGPMPDHLAPRCYAIPTKDEHLRRLPLSAIAEGVERFLAFARARSDLAFFVSAIGCGLAGYRPADIAPLFADAPASCTLPEGWR